MIGITFGTKHSYTDWGVFMEDFQVTPPQPQRYTSEVPGRNGVLDMTAQVTSHIKFGPRTLTAVFRVKAGSWSSVMSQIYSDVHGRTLQIVTDMDPDYYWKGFCTIDTFQSEERTGKLVITAECDPYKYDGTFEGYGRAGSGELNCVCGRMEVVPTFTITGGSATIQWGEGNSATLSEGYHKIANLEFTEGDNVLTITAESGVVIFVGYKKGEL